MSETGVSYDKEDTYYRLSEFLDTMPGGFGGPTQRTPHRIEGTIRLKK